MNKMLNLASGIIRSNFGNLDAPYRITYIVTHKCQLECSICGIWKKPNGNELSVPEIRKFFERSNRFAWVNLSGGEIFLREDISEIIGAIYENCRGLYILDFPTNGFAGDRIVKNVGEIIKNDIPKIFTTVSLDGPESVHDRIRGVKNSWARAVDTFKNLRRLENRRFKAFFGMTLQPFNVDLFDETFAAVKTKVPDITYDDIHVNIAHHSRHYYANDKIADDPVSRWKIWTAMKHISGLRKTGAFNPVHILERRYQALAKSYIDTGRTPVACQALSVSIFMDPAGNIYPCSIYGKNIGNIRDFGYDIRNLYRLKSLKSARNNIINGGCPQCWTPCEAYQSILAKIL